MTDIPCKCGHSKSLHFNFGHWAGCQKRERYGVGSTEWADECKEYIPDNLKFLEDLYTKMVKEI